MPSAERPPMPERKRISCSAKHSETRHAGRRIDRLCHPCGGSEARAVVGCTKKGAALEDFAWSVRTGVSGFELVRSVAIGLRRAAGWQVERIRVPVAAPCPNVADHVVQAATVGRESTDRRGPFVAIGAEVLVRKLARQRLAICAPSGIRVSPQANSIACPPAADRSAL